MSSDPLERGAAPAEAGAEPDAQGKNIHAQNTSPPVHPVADAFPMLPAEGLRGLADDIAAHGLHEPIVTRDGVLIDGRNRLAACRLAEVEPTFRELPLDVDPVAFILSANLGRRHMTKGAQAITLALAEHASGGFAHGTKAELSSGFGISDRYLRMARTVLENDIVIEGERYYCDAVMTGSRSLRDAYDEATQPPITAAEVVSDDPRCLDRLRDFWCIGCWIVRHDPTERSGWLWDLVVGKIPGNYDFTTPGVAVQVAEGINSAHDEVIAYLLDVQRSAQVLGTAS